MFITEESTCSSPARSCAAARRHARAAAARRDGAGADAARADRRARRSQRFGFVYVPHGSIMKDWTPAQAGAGFEFSPILKPLERFRNQLTVLTGLTNNGENGHSASTAMWLSGTFPSKGSVHPARHDGRPDHRAEDRPGHDVPVDGARDRGSLEPPRQLRRRLPLLVHEHHLLADADAAAADGDQPARRVRADVRRRRRDAGGAARAPRAEHAASSTRSRESVRRPAARPRARRDRAKLGEYLDNVREIERRIQQAEQQRDRAPARGAADADRRARELGRARQADVRAAWRSPTRAT